jgi:2-octaprenyl-6-methoxyphenol hydroxylase
MHHRPRHEDLEMNHTRTRIGIVGAGPVGLALALLLAQRSDAFDVTLHDARTLDHDVSRDARTLALSLGSVQLLQRLSAWHSGSAQPIQRVHVSEQPTNLLDASVTIDAKDVGCDSLGAVLPYGALVAPMQRRWLEEVQAATALDPTRLRNRFAAAVQSVQPGAQGGVDVVCADDVTDAYDLVVIAEGGVFADQARKAIALDYAQTAWVPCCRCPDGLAAHRRVPRWCGA